jgi:hypothetical protein
MKLGSLFDGNRANSQKIKGGKTMTTYLTIITTVLVLTQIIRVSQNHFILLKQNKVFNKHIEELVEIEVRKEDYENQRKFYKLAIEKMERELLKETDGN